MTGRADDSRPAEVSSDGGIEAVLLDIDGTLLDSNDAHAQAWSDAFRESGLEIGSETVLLVEDEQALRQVGKFILETYGYTVLLAADGAAARPSANPYGRR